MGRHLQYVSADRIIAKLYRDLGLEELNETDIIEQIGEALEFIGAVTLYEEAVAFVEVENHQADLPNGLHSIIQIARNNKWSKQNKDLCPANIITDCSTEELVQDGGCGCHELQGSIYPVPLDCHGSPLTDYEVAYYRPYFDLQYEYYGWNHSNRYIQDYTPIRLANHSFFNTVVCEEEDPSSRPYYHANYSQDEYTIVEDKIRFSFKEGSVAIAYYRQKIDPDTGYPMIPDEVSIVTAITMYITMKYMARLWYLGREGYGDKYQKAESDWQWYCKQAGNKQMMIYGVDQHENFKDIKQQLIPKNNRYYGYFGKMGRPEDTRFKDPNRRSFRLRGI